MKKVYIIDAARTPFGKLGGSLATLSATELATQISSKVIERSRVDPGEFDSVVGANVVQSSSDAIYFSRHVALKNKIKQSTPCLNVNRLCGSGFEALVQAAYRIILEGDDLVLVTASESMSQIPYVLRGARFGYRLGHGKVEDYLMESLTDSHTGLAMAITAENLAEQYSISRADVDTYSFESQQKTIKAWNDKQFSDEVISVDIKNPKGDIVFSKDEHFRSDISLESIKKLPSLFKKDGTVTAATASGICDGAASVIVASEAWVEKNGVQPLGELKSWASVGCDPKIMGIGPVPAIKKNLELHNKLHSETLCLNSVDKIEINEAFAAQYLAVEKELSLDRAKTNRCGGAIAIGHPLATTGLRLVAHTLFDLKNNGQKTGIASACIGGGQGMSVILETLT